MCNLLKLSLGPEIYVATSLSFACYLAGPTRLWPRLHLVKGPACIDFSCAGASPADSQNLTWRFIVLCNALNWAFDWQIDWSRCHQDL